MKALDLMLSGKSRGCRVSTTLLPSTYLTFFFYVDVVIGSLTV